MHRCALSQVVKIKGATTIVKMIMLIAGLAVILLLLTSVFGRGIAFGLLGIAAESEPGFLQEELRSFLTVAAVTQGYAEFIIPLEVNHIIEIYEENEKAYIHVKPPPTGYGGFYADPGRTTFFSNFCEIERTRIAFDSSKDSSLIIKKILEGDKCEITIDVLGDISADLDPPELSNFVVSTSYVTGTEMLRFSVHVKDISSIREITILLNLDGEINEYPMEFESGLEKDGTYSYLASPVPGSYKWEVHATDGAGNTAVSEEQTFGLGG